MNPQTTDLNGKLSQLVLVRPEPQGSFTAQVVGLQELSATAPSREEALEQVRVLIGQWMRAGQLEAVQVDYQNPLMKYFGQSDPNDPEEKVYLEELARERQRDLEQTLREYEDECSDSSSTPTT